MRSLIFGLIATALTTNLGAETPAAKVYVEKVHSGPILQTLPIIGRAVARQSGVIAARVNGAVVSVRVQVGDRVGPGHVLLVQDDSLKRAELSRYVAEIAVQRAKLSTAQAKLELAAQEMSRLSALESSAALPKARFEDQRQEMVRFRSGVQEARAQLARAKANKHIGEIGLERTTVKAIYPGVILHRHTSPGAFLRAGDAIVTMLNDRKMELEVDVPTDRLPGLAVGSSVGFKTQTEPSRQAMVRAIVPDENPLTRTRTVRLTPVPNNAPKLTQNESVIVEVPVSAPRTILSVHKDAVLNRRGNNIVYVVVDGTALVRQVRLGEAVGTRFEVLSGLNKGEIAVVRGNERLRPGQKVRYKDGS